LKEGIAYSTNWEYTALKLNAELKDFLISKFIRRCSALGSGEPSGRGGRYATVPKLNHSAAAAAAAA